jgi:hypothetical protein
MRAMMSSSVSPSCSLRVGETDSGCERAVVVLPVFGRGVATGDTSFETIFGDGLGVSSFLTSLGSGIGEGLGERGIMPRDLRAAVAV